MNVTPELLEEFEFRRKGRGYDPDQVDELLSRAATTLSEVAAQLDEQRARADEAEARVAEAEARSRTDSESDETIQRTLLLAQRTADAAVQEAEETAGRKVAEANEEARRLLAEAESARSTAMAEAEDDVRAHTDEVRERLQQEISSLEAIRDALMSDVESLEGHLETERRSIRDSIDSLGELLARSERLGQVDLPELSQPPAALPDEAWPPVVDEPEPVAVPADEAAPGPVDGVPAPPPPPPEQEALLPEPEPEEEPPARDFAAAWDAPDVEAADTEVAADPPPPPPPPPDDLGPVPDAVAADPPPPPPPPPGDDEPAPPATLDEAIGSAGFGALDPESDDEEGDNPWLAELDEGEEAGRSGRRRFGRR